MSLMLKPDTTAILCNVLKEVRAWSIHRLPGHRLSLFPSVLTATLCRNLGGCLRLSESGGKMMELLFRQRLLKKHAKAN